jgi:hypothetical protein
VITSQLPASTFVSTILITQSLTVTQIVPIMTTIYETDYYPASSSIGPFYPLPSSSAVPSVSCDSGCQIDVTATRLAYPGTVVVSTVLVPTVTLEITTDASGNVRSTGLYTRPLPATTSSAITWEFSGVPLTYPTVYAAYATFNRVSISAVDNVCQTSVLSLALPTPTDWPPLIIVESLIPTPTLVAPRVVSYLNTLPTVTAQLGGPIGANACDPIVGPPTEEETTSLGMTTFVSSVAAVGRTATSFVAQLDSLPSEPAAPLPPSATLQPPASSAAPSRPPPPPPSETPLPPSPSATPQPSSEVSQSSAIAAPSVSSPPPPSPSSAAPESSRADSASQVPSAPASPLAPPESSAAPVPPPYEVSSSVVPSSAAPPPPVTPSRSTTSSRTSLDGTASGPAASSSFSFFTGAAALPTGNVVGWLVGAAGVGLGLI